MCNNATKDYEHAACTAWRPGKLVLLFMSFLKVSQFLVWWDVQSSNNPTGSSIYYLDKKSLIQSRPISIAGNQLCV